MWKDRGSAEWCSTVERKERKGRKRRGRTEGGREMGTEEGRNIGDKERW